MRTAERRLNTIKNSKHYVIVSEFIKQLRLRNTPADRKVGGVLMQYMTPSAFFMLPESPLFLFHAAHVHAVGSSLHPWTANPWTRPHAIARGSHSQPHA